MNNLVKIRNTFFHRHVLIELTKKCNLKCLHCFTDAGIALPNELSEKEWEAVSYDLIISGFNAFTISGGEPLLIFDKVFSLVKFMKKQKKNIKIYLFTNGIMLNKEILYLCQKYINGIGISLDGTRDTHDWLRGKAGSYDKTVKALKILHAMNYPIFVQSMVTPQTIPYMEEVLLLCIKNGVRAIRFSHVDFFGRALRGKDVIGCNANNLIELNNQLQILKSKYSSSIFITSNLMIKTDLKKRPQAFSNPSLHILPNGYVLPWYGFPKNMALFRYPKESFSSITQAIISEKLKNFNKILVKTNAYIFKNNNLNNILDYDNIIAKFLLSKGGDF